MCVFYASYGKCSKNSNSKILISKRKIPNIHPLQNLLLPFAWMVRRENKLRVFFFFDVRNFRTFTILYIYCKHWKDSDTWKICCNHSKIWTMWLYHSVMSPNDADGMANSADPDQTAPLGAVWTGSALFAQAYLSENLGSLRYPKIWTV